MSAFGRRPGMGGNGSGGRPSFGSARPMKGGGFVRPEVDGGEQFPPIESADLPPPEEEVFDSPLFGQWA